MSHLKKNGFARFNVDRIDLAWDRAGGGLV